jgi:hypothetical protein
LPLSSIKQKLERIGCNVEVTSNKLTITHNNNSKSFDASAEWIAEIKSFNKSIQYEFDADKRKLVGPKTIEIGLIRLSQHLFSSSDNRIFSAANRAVEMSKASKKFALHFFHSEEYKEFFDEIFANRLKSSRNISMDEMFWFPRTIKYSVTRKIDRSKLLSEGVPALEACLFKLAVENGICWEFSKNRKRRNSNFFEEKESETSNIPNAVYDTNMLKYFKVAVSSQFPSQSYLAFYHVLEYNFLTVSDEALQNKLKAQVSSTNFQATSENLAKIISIVKKHGDISDETEMLTRVLRKYVDEDELIAFIEDLESKNKDIVYTKSQEIFGEKFTINPKKDHAISNVAKLLKHVRNALVHSSDRYNRDDCHIPLTESEDIVETYVPLIRFLAEKVIYAKSS